MATRNFLDLPNEVRLRIYQLSGLIRSCPIALNPAQASYGTSSFLEEPTGLRQICYYHFKKSEENDVFELADRDCICPRLPIELLLVAKAVYKETWAVLHSKNRFLLRAYKASHLATLAAIPRQAIAAITSLLIRLNCWPCPFGHDQVNPSRPHCWLCQTAVVDSDPILDLTTPAGLEMAENWKELCSILSTHITPRAVDLTFICDTATRLDTEQITNSLMTLPAFRKCTIHLGRFGDPALEKLAHKVSLKMTDAIVAKGIFPFARLPQELRLRILNYTHLGALGTYLLTFSLLRIEDSRLLNGQSQRINRLICCSKCTYAFTGCCCPANYAAYSTSCHCRFIPWGIFTVSKQMYEDVIEIFYSKNIFKFCQDPLSVVSFFRSLPPRALPFIHKLAFRFSEEQMTGWEKEGWNEKWSELVEFIKIEMNLSRLYITIDMVEAVNLFLVQNANSDLDEDMRFVDDQYWYVAKTLSTMKGLKNATFELGWWKDMKELLEKTAMGDRWKGKLTGAEDRSQMQLDAPRWRVEEIEALWQGRSYSTDG